MVSKSRMIGEDKIRKHTEERCTDKVRLFLRRVFSVFTFVFLDVYKQPVWRRVSYCEEGFLYLMQLTSNEQVQTAKTKLGNIGGRAFDWNNGAFKFSKRGGGTNRLSFCAFCLRNYFKRAPKIKYVRDKTNLMYKMWREKGGKYQPRVLGKWSNIQ